MSNSIENALIAAVLLILIFIPIILSVRHGRNKRKRELANELSVLENDHNLSFQLIEELDSFSIVIDPVKKVIVIVYSKDFRSELIDLKQVSDCILEEKKQGKAIQLLLLVLLDKKSQPVHNIVFYRQYADNERSIRRATVIAGEWLEMIKAAIADHKSSPILDKTN